MKEELQSYFDNPNYTEKKIGSHFFAKIAKVMPIILHITRAEDLKVLYVNDKFEQYLGYTAEDIRNMEGNIFSVVDPDYQAPVLEEINKLKTSPSTDYVITHPRIRHKDGAWVYLQNTSSVFEVDEQGAPLTFIGFSEVITDRILALQKKEQYEKMVSLAEESFLYGAWEWEIATNKVFWTKGIFDLYGLDYEMHKDSLTFERYISFIAEDERETIYNQLQEHFQKGEAYTIEHTIKTPKGEIRHMRGRGKPVFDEAGNLVRYIGAVWNITDFALMQKDYKINQIKLDEAESLLKLGTWEWDMLQDQITWSDGMWSIFEYTPEQRKNGYLNVDFYRSHQKNVEDVNAEMVAAHFANLKEGDTTALQTEDVIVANKGTVKYLQTSLRVTEWKDGRPSRSVGSTADISDLKLIQKDLEKKVFELHKAYQEAEQFSYIASHDLKEPLRKITTFGERLQSKLGDDLPERTKIYLDKMIDGANRMNILIGNLLELSRTKRKPEDFVATDLNDVLENVQQNLEFLIDEKKAALEVDRLPELEVIPDQIGQLFQNLIGNALKFTKEGEKPTIQITVAQVTNEDKVDSVLDMFSDYVHFQVRDNGIGFETEYGEQIFTPFKRLHGRSTYEGTGIGLAICKKVVQNHNGKIWAEGKLDEGAVFHFILPLKQPIAAFQSTN